MVAPCKTSQNSQDEKAVNPLVLFSTHPLPSFSMVSTAVTKSVLNKAITQSEKRMKKYMSMSIAEIASASEEKMKKYFDERDDRLFEILDKRIEERIDVIYVYMAELKEETKLHFDAVAENSFMILEVALAMCMRA